MSSNKKSKEQMSPLEAMSRQLTKKWRDSGLTVTEETGQTEEEYQVFFPRNRSAATEDLTQVKSEGNTLAATITVEWGYENHSITLTPNQWSDVKSGEGLGVEGDGYYYEGDFFEDFWNFGSAEDSYSLEVSYGHDGGTGYIGSLSDATVEEHQWAGLPEQDATGKV